jgi:hypothetical protein
MSDVFGYVLAYEYVMCCFRVLVFPSPAFVWKCYARTHGCGTHKAEGTRKQKEKEKEKEYTHTHTHTHLLTPNLILIPIRLL